MNNGKKKLIHLIVDGIVIFILIVADLYTKNLAVLYLKDKPALSLIENVFELNYLENRGAAFGIFQNQKAAFLIIGVVMLTLVGYVLYKMPVAKKYTLLEVGLCLLAAGAIGNMIDRIIHDYVVDFFYFVLINFPIFNMADIYVTVSCVILAILIIWVYKEDDLQFLSNNMKKQKKDKVDE